MCRYNGLDDGRVGLYVAAEPLTRAKNYFEVEIVDAGVMGTIGWNYFLSVHTSVSIKCGTDHDFVRMFEVYIRLFCVISSIASFL